MTGGVVYRGSSSTGWRDRTLYGDYCSGTIWGLRKQTPVGRISLLLDTPFSITAFGEDEAGEIYVTDYAGGKIYRIVDQS